MGHWRFQERNTWCKCVFSVEEQKKKTSELTLSVKIPKNTPKRQRPRPTWRPLEIEMVSPIQASVERVEALVAKQKMKADEENLRERSLKIPRRLTKNNQGQNRGHNL